MRGIIKRFKSLVTTRNFSDNIASAKRSETIEKISEIFSMLRSSVAQTNLLNNLKIWNKTYTIMDNLGQEFEITELDYSIRQMLEKVQNSNNSISVHDYLALTELAILLRISDFKSSQFISLVRFIESYDTLLRLENGLNSETDVDSLVRIWTSFYRLRINAEAQSMLLGMILKQELSTDNFNKIISCPLLVSFMRSINKKDMLTLINHLEPLYKKIIEIDCSKMTVVEMETVINFCIVKSKIHLPISEDELAKVLTIVKNRSEELSVAIVRSLIGIIGHFSTPTLEEHRVLFNEAFNSMHNVIKKANDNIQTKFYLAYLEIMVEGKPRNIEDLLASIEENFQVFSAFNLGKYILCYLHNQRKRDFRSLDEKLMGKISNLYDQYNMDMSEDSNSNIDSNSIFLQTIEPLLSKLGLEYSTNFKHQIFFHDFLINNPGEWIRKNSEIFGEETNSIASFFEGEYPSKLAVEELYYSRLSPNSSNKSHNLFYGMLRRLRQNSKIIVIPIKSTFVHYLKFQGSEGSELKKILAFEIQKLVTRENQRIQRNREKREQFAKENK